MKDQTGDQRGSEWEALKNSPRWEQDICPEFIPTNLSSNRQGDTSQHVTSSPEERSGKARRKAEAREKQSAQAKHNIKRKQRFITVPKKAFHLAKQAMIYQLLAQLKISESKA